MEWEGRSRKQREKKGRRWCYRVGRNGMHLREEAERRGRSHNIKKCAEILRGFGKVYEGRPRGKKAKCEGQCGVKEKD